MSVFAIRNTLPSIIVAVQLENGIEIIKEMESSLNKFIKNFLLHTFKNFIEIIIENPKASGKVTLGIV